MNVQVGDWGREGMQNQTAVAALMAQVADSQKPDFILSMGDNFYESTCCWPSWFDCTAHHVVHPSGMYACAACWAELSKSKLAGSLPQSQHLPPSLAVCAVVSQGFGCELHARLPASLLLHSSAQQNTLPMLL